MDVRVIAATNRDVAKLIREGKFREDLYYRLNIIPVELPPLRERGDDIRLLAEFYLDAYAREFRRNVTGLSDAGIRKLMNHTWPGNVRELKNTLERAVLLAKRETLSPDDLLVGREHSPEADGFRLPPNGISLQEVEEKLVRQALALAKNNQSEAARLLHISRDQLRYRMQRFNMS